MLWQVIYSGDEVSYCDNCYKIIFHLVTPPALVLFPSLIPKIIYVFVLPVWCAWLNVGAHYFYLYFFAELQFVTWCCYPLLTLESLQSLSSSWGCIVSVWLCMWLCFVQLRRSDVQLCDHLLENLNWFAANASAPLLYMYHYNSRYIFCMVCFFALVEWSHVNI